MLAYRKIAVLSIAFVFGCGGDDDGGDGADGADGADGTDDGDDGGDGVDDTTPLTELSSGEAMALCEEVNDGVTDLLLDLQTITCYLSGIGQKDCEGLVEECLGMEPFDPGFTCDITSGDELPACASDITVGDIRDCFDALFADFASLADDITCESNPKDFDGFLDELPAECAYLDTCEV
jgi:hypothetical protein